MRPGRMIQRATGLLPSPPVLRPTAASQVSEGRCPECGTPFDPETLQNRWESVA